MSRYYASVSRKFRTLQSRLPGMGKLHKYSKKPRYPGQHGAKIYRKKTFYKICLIEKQKLRYNYGLTDNKLKFYVKQAKEAKSYTSQVLLKILNRRLDAVLFYARLTKSIQSARQTITHRKVRINHQTMSSPSYICSPNDLITVFLHYVLKLFTQKLRGKNLQFLIDLVFGVRICMTKSLLNKVSLISNRKKRRNRDNTFIQMRKPKINLARVIEFYSRKI